MSDDENVINGPWQGRPAANICPHETPGGAQRCALCRHAIERQHEGWEVAQDVPSWKRLDHIAERQSVPMPDHVRKVWDELRQGRPRTSAEQGELL